MINKIEQKLYKLIKKSSLPIMTDMLIEATLTTVGKGLNAGDAWPDGIFTRYGERRVIGPAAMPRGMKQLVAPASDAIYGGEGSLRLVGLPRTKITPEFLKSDEVLDPHKHIRSDEPPLHPKMRIYGRRVFGKSPEYIIPKESANFVTTTEDLLVKPTTPPEGSIRTGGSEEGAIDPTPEPGSKELGSSTGYRQVQKGGKNIVRGGKGSLDKMYIYKMLGQYDSKKEGLKESIKKETILKLIKVLKEKGSLPVKLKQVLSKNLKRAKPDPKSKRAVQFLQHHKFHSGPHITGEPAEPDTYDFDDDYYDAEGGIQRRKDKQKRGYEPVENYLLKITKSQLREIIRRELIKEYNLNGIGVEI